MGIGVAALNLMVLARASGADFSRVLTVGRQKVELSPDELERYFQQRGRPDLAARVSAETGDGYCESLLKAAFGSTLVHSMDASDYENATIVHDLNKPVEPSQQYSVVLDFGTLEHVFNVPVAFDNVERLAAPGAHILHNLPGNNRAGHGFYQFSPEFFFQIYAPERGFSETRVFAVGGASPDVWYEAHAPREIKRRVNITSRDQLNMLVLTRKTGQPVPLAEKPVQQSDYVALWGNERRSAKPRARRGPFERAARAAFDGIRHLRKVARQNVSAGRGDMTLHRVMDLTGQFCFALTTLSAVV